MKASRFTAEQIVAILHEAAAGRVVRELCRRHGITETTFYRWRANTRSSGAAPLREPVRRAFKEGSGRRLQPELR